MTQAIKEGDVITWDKERDGDRIVTHWADNRVTFQSEKSRRLVELPDGTILKWERLALLRTVGVRTRFLNQGGGVLTLADGTRLSLSHLLVGERAKVLRIP